METSKFIKEVEKEIKFKIVSSLHKYLWSNNEDIDTTDIEVIQVWYCKTIQNHKGLFIARDIESNIIYPYFIEATYDGDRNKIYLDYYKKEFKDIVNI